MLKKSTNIKKGSIIFFEHTSKILKGNLLGDPHIRTFPVYIPWQYHSARNKNRKFPVLFDLAGFTGSGLGRVNWKNFEESVPERIDRLIHQQKLKPFIIVFPDCFTSLGGNQYINSSAIGRYADYLTLELIPHIDNELRSLASREHRGCLGKSSGGYGALIHGMKYTKFWGAVGSHSGDAYFDFVYRTEWPQVLTHLQKFSSNTKVFSSLGVNNIKKSLGEDDGRVARFLKYAQNQTALSSPDITALMILAMAASYDPDTNAPNNFRLPFDLDTGELINDRWKQWLRHDPIFLVEKYQKNLKKLKGVYIDCGSRDQYHIHFGSRKVSHELTKQNIQHLYQEFDGTHSGIDYRLDVSLPFLSKALQ